MGRTGHLARPALGVATLATLAVGTTVALTRPAAPLATARTTVAEASGAAVVHADGSSAPLVAGATLGRGDVVRTNRHGHVVLRTRERSVYLASAGVLQVLDGARQQLRVGSVVVDAQRGAQLSVQVADDRVEVPHGSATELYRGVVSRTGSLAGTAVVTSTAGRRLVVPALTQTSFAGDALSGLTAPLRLTDSAGEARAVPALVADDRSLRTLADGIDATGGQSAGAVLASWSGRQVGTAAGTKRSERVLPVVVADATRGGNVQQRYDHAVAWRSNGGSWGVVLHLLSGRFQAVLREYAALQQGLPSGSVGTITASRLGTAPVAAGTIRPGAGQPDRGVNPSAPAQPTSPTHSHPPAGGTPSPSPSPGPVQRLTTTLTTIVGGVTKRLPGHHPTPTPSPTHHGLVGTLLGH